MKWTDENGMLFLRLGLGWLAVWLMMPSDKKKSRILGGLFGVVAILMMQWLLLPPAGDICPEYPVLRLRGNGRCQCHVDDYRSKSCLFRVVVRHSDTGLCVVCSC